MATHKINFSDIEKIDIIITKNMTDNQVYAKYKPNYLLNLALYDMKTGENITYLEDENKLSGFLFSDRGIGITTNSKVVWCKKDEAYKSNEIKDYCSGSPILVENGKRTIDWGNKYSNYVGDSSHYRTYVGFNDKSIFVGCTDTKYSINSLADYCVQQGMKYAINADGNGSQSLWVNGKAIKDSVRKNASWLMIWTKSNTTPQNTPVKKEDGEAMVVKEKILVNGKLVELDTITKDGKTFIEMRELSTLLNATVGYNAATKQKSITKK